MGIFNRNFPFWSCA